MMNLDNMPMNKQPSIPSTTVNREKSVQLNEKKYTGLTMKTLTDEEPCEYDNIDYSNMGMAKLKKISGFANNKRNIAS